MRLRSGMPLVCAAIFVACTSPDAESSSTLREEATKQPVVANGARRTRYLVTLRRDALAKQSTTKEADKRFPEFHEARAINLVKSVERAHRITALSAFSLTSLGFVADLTEAEAKVLSGDPQVESLEASTLLPFSSTGPRWTNTTVSGETRSWGKNAVNPTTASFASGPRVYVIDSSMTLHPDLNVVHRFHAGSPTGLIEPCYGHGTHVAGIIGAQVNGVGTQGVAPSAPIVSISVAFPFDQCTGSTSADTAAIANALEWVAGDVMTRGQVGIVNISINGLAFGPNANEKRSLRQRMLALATPSGAYRGAFIAQSAGNQQEDACLRSFGPAAPNDGIMVVGAINDHGQSVRRLNGVNGFRNGQLAGSEPGSNFGPCVEVWAPGRSIRSTWPGGYEELSGTSMSAPHVAGLAATLVQPGDTGPMVEQRVRALIDNLGSFDVASAPIGLPTVSPLPAGVPHNAPYAEAVMSVAPPDATASVPSAYVVYSDEQHRIWFDSAGAPWGCDLFQQRLPAGPTTPLANFTQGVVGPVSWPAGTWRIGSNACPNASATITSCDRVVPVWHFNGQPQAPNARQTLTVSQAATLAYSTMAANPASCELALIYRPPVSFPSEYPGYPLTGQPTNSSVVIRRDLADYSYTITCADACGGRGSTSFQLSIVPDPVNDAVVTSVSGVPSTLAAGSTFTASITVQNTGTTTWTPASGYRLGSQSPQDNVSWGTARLYLSAGESIGPGQSKTFTSTFTAPSTPGTYAFQWRMVRESVGWFGGLSPNVTVTVSGAQLTPRAGAWFNPARSGHGVELFPVAGGSWVFVWYTYTPWGAPIWYLADVAPLSNNTFASTLYLTTWNGAGTDRTPIGSVSLTFSSATTAQLAYTVNGVSGSEPIQHLAGGEGRSGAWYEPALSGWGLQLEEQPGFYGATIAFYEGSQPRWVMGTALPGPAVGMALSWYGGPGLCPGCTYAGSPTPTPAGTLDLHVGEGAFSGYANTLITTPSGWTWNRPWASIAKLTQ